MDLGLKVWLKNDKNKFFGSGPKNLLLKIEESGSLRKGAAKLNMSYSKAWNMVSNIEKNLDFKVLDKTIGGVEGGGSSLTDEAKEFIKKYHEFEREVEESIKKIYKKHF
ncbi:winged helix-turn-helix domain-containing protein [Tepidibacter mesophilus]|uniref:winged helix-turn-helix domain-containing protein n=1 Tax=Tepidibacter mesophilus TaxID=655607 RepID=UPI000C085B17|nr:LysR family transcriptional regulator [Tepidibacter mesophilus]